MNAWRDMNQDWSKPITVLLHPINADNQVTTKQYIQQISLDNLEDVRMYLQEQSQKTRGQAVNFYFQLGRELIDQPPKLPEQQNVLKNILWSLKFRFYAWKQRKTGDGNPSVTLYLNFYDPKQTPRLKHSTALERGRIGSVNLFASQKQNETNKVVLVHELLHTFGAQDKYDLATGQPIYPIGYTKPNQEPLYPQRSAEIMGGYIPISKTENRTPPNLRYTMISDLTARELGWIK